MIPKSSFLGRGRLGFSALLLAAALCLFHLGVGAESPSQAKGATAQALWVQTGNHGETPPGGEGGATALDRIRRDFLALFLILIVAKLGGDLMERIKQPAVLGELIFGVALGSLGLLGYKGGGSLERFVLFLREDIVLEALAEVGVVLLLFQIGLESTVAEMGKVGAAATAVATLGVIAPFFLGWGVSGYFLPRADTMVHVFIGSVLCATSVGITARVYQDIGKLHTKEAKIVLGAAVVDDVLGLIVLAVVMGVIHARSSGGSLRAVEILWILAKATAFFVGSIAAGVFLSPRLFKLASFLKAQGVLLSLSLVICFFFAWLAATIGLAPIVGAFCAGLILEDASFRELGDFRRHHLAELIAPIAAFLVPIFFVRMGVMVQLETFAEPGVLPFAVCLTLAAIIGKQICYFGVNHKTTDGIAVGLGMIPRGEVGLIVASYGMSMVILGRPVIDGATYSAIVIMVMTTTLVTPPVLTWRMRRLP
ncbi:MAG: cation:proton antiporter [Candidatus Sumerlaeota bacterium]|nr:cation:proton antiporter [Candidatus Sumerlaeota bacterium]